MANWLESLIGSFLNPKKPEKTLKVWAEVAVDTYWHRHLILESHSWKNIERGLGTSVQCIGLYTGPKTGGQEIDASDIPFMQGYQGNPGLVKYYNGAEPS